MFSQGLLLEVFVAHLGGDGGVDFLLLGDAILPPVSRVADHAASDHVASLARGISHSSQVFLSAAFSFSHNGSNVALPFVPDNIDLGVVSDGLEGYVLHALIDEPVADVPL